MPHEDGRHRDDRRIPMADRDDFGQSDYSTGYGYDPRRRVGYRADVGVGRRPVDYGPADYATDYGYARGDHRDGGQVLGDYARRAEAADYRRQEDSRSWMDRAGDFLSGGPREERAPRRRGPSDRVLWAVIVERLEDERRLDLSDVEVIVEDCEVTLNGTVRRKEDKRRIEDVADIDGIRHVQNNLRVRDRDGWTFL